MGWGLFWLSLALLLIVFAQPTDAKMNIAAAVVHFLTKETTK